MGPDSRAFSRRLRADRPDGRACYLVLIRPAYSAVFANPGISSGRWNSVPIMQAPRLNTHCQQVLGLTHAHSEYSGATRKPKACQAVALCHRGRDKSRKAAGHCRSSRNSRPSIGTGPRPTFYQTRTRLGPSRDLPRPIRHFPNPRSLAAPVQSDQRRNNERQQRDSARSSRSFVRASLKTGRDSN